MRLLRGVDFAEGVGAPVELERDLVARGRRARGRRDG